MLGHLWNNDKGSHCIEGKFHLRIVLSCSPNKVAYNVLLGPIFPGPGIRHLGWATGHFPELQEIVQVHSTSQDS